MSACSLQGFSLKIGYNIASDAEVRANTYRKAHKRGRMGTEINPAWISVVAALLGTVVGGIIAVGKDVFFEHRKISREKTYLAVIVSSHLNEFATMCASVAYDDGTSDGMPARDGIECEPTTDAPSFNPLSIKVNWEVLPSDLLDSILNLPSKQASIESFLAYLIRYEPDPPQHEEFFWTRRKSYAELTILVLDLSKELREHANLKTHQNMGGSSDSIKNEMQRIITMVNEKKKARSNRLNKRNTNQES